MRPIDADELKMHTFVPHEVEHDAYKLGWNDAILAIVDNAPTIDPVEHGRWKYENRNCGVRASVFALFCSECDAMSVVANNYCPNCGAKMDGGDADERVY